MITHHRGGAVVTIQFDVSMDTFERMEAEAMTSSPTPKYRRHKSRKRDRAFVEINGQRKYLGRYNTPESKERYHRLLAEWQANHGQLPVKPIEMSITELIAA